MSKKEDVWDVNDFRKHFGIGITTSHTVAQQSVKKTKQPKEVPPDGILERKGNTAKYGNTRVRIDGIVFDSLKEGNYYKMLKDRKERGTIEDFEIHKRWKFIHNDILICSYTCDFVIRHLGGVEEVIDVKSFATRMKKDYIIRKKMMKAFFGIDIVEA